MVNSISCLNTITIDNVAESIKKILFK